MTSRGHRLSVAAPTAVLALALALSGCGGADDEPSKETEPTVTAGVTLTPGGEQLEFGESANLTWAPDQNTKGLVSVSVEGIVQGAKKDVTRIQITPKPEDPHLYYVTVKVTNLGKADLGGQNVAGLPLYLDEGTDMLNRAALLAENMKFDLCPRSTLPKEFTKGDSAEVCLVYVPGSEIERMVLQPADGDSITWEGALTTPKPSPSKPAKKKPGAKAKPTAKATADTDKG